MCGCGFVYAGSHFERIIVNPLAPPKRSPNFEHIDFYSFNLTVLFFPLSETLNQILHKYYTSGLKKQQALLGLKENIIVWITGGNTVLFHFMLAEFFSVLAGSLFAGYVIWTLFFKLFCTFPLYIFWNYMWRHEEMLKRTLICTHCSIKCP